MGGISNMDKELKRFDIKIEIDADETKAEDGKMTFGGYGATFGGKPDHHNDIIAEGAFAKTLQEKSLEDIKLLYQHDRWIPIGVFTELKENKTGLKFKAELANTQWGSETYELLKMKALNSMSIGFYTNEADFDRQSGVRTIKEVELMEISVVTFPANENARINRVKSQEDIEFRLRFAGFSEDEIKKATVLLAPFLLQSESESVIDEDKDKDKDKADAILDDKGEPIVFTDAEAEEIRQAIKGSHESLTTPSNP